MHQQAMQFLTEMQKQFPASFEGNVLECGSLNINGSARHLFDATEYIGVDSKEGKDVDYVSLTHEFNAKPDEYFDTVISTEMLEHDPFWHKSIDKMVRFVKPGGALIITYAGPKRPKHELWASPQEGYYFSPSVIDVYSRIVGESLFKYTLIRIMDDPNDIYFFMAGKSAIRS